MLGGEAVLRGEARRALLWEHLLPWVPVYARAAVAQAAGPTYRAWAETLEAVIRAEAEILTSPGWPGDSLPVHLRAAPEPVVPGDGGLDGFLAQMLVPVRSGMVVTRRDLAGAARGLGLGLRVGERRFILCALAAQDPVAICGWLAGEARAWADHHSRLVPALGPVAGFGRPGPRRPPSGCSNAGRTWSLSPTPAEGGGGY